MKIPYSFSVLRYVHDPVTTEFVNVGVALYAPDAKYLSAICTPHYTRLSEMFGRIDGEHSRQITRYLQDRIEEMGGRVKSELPFPESPRTIGGLLATVLPPDDSALQFSTPGRGYTSDPEKTLGGLYHRYVEYYTLRTSYPSRSDDEVWKVFRKPLEEQHVAQALKPKRIVAPDYDYEFKSARKNEVWHTYEPVSFDLMEAASIVDKANTWVGRITSLARSEEKFKPYFLLGQPRETKLHVAFIKAQNILHRIPCDHEFVQETNAEDFAKHLKAEVEKHGEQA
ncbi:MAG TPA: DUF3037 domain-containing protein [Terriglobia bacterium]|nr:DUF3037 domain-containing protein [Terriglobia bacterium]